MERSGEKTSFSVACNLLSRYIKEKRSVPELVSGMACKGKLENIGPPTTMSFLPGVDIFASSEEKAAKLVGGDAMELLPQFGPAGETQKSLELREQEKAQLTIFYDGKVLVFDHFLAEKAKDLIQFACDSSTKTQNFGYAAATAPDTKMADNPVKTENNHQKTAAATVSNIPIAPRASLHRFLEKRKHRITAAAPYQVSDISASPSPVKPQEGKSWLGLASKSSTPILNLNLNSNWQIC